jgi:TolA-binding protein
MTCARYGDTDAAERYVTGAMSEAEQATFEEHFFECEACLAGVRMLQDLQATLPLTASPNGRTPAVSVRDRSVPGWARWAGLAAAAVLVLAGASWFVLGNAGARATLEAPKQADSEPSPAAPTPPITQTPPPPTPNAAGPADSRPTREMVLAELAVMTPPPYFPLTTRGEAARDRADFDAAMAHYAAGRYADAARGLRALIDRAPESVHAEFFLGISELASGRRREGRTALQRVVQSGVSPFADEAHFYLAKAALADRNVDVAKQELTRAIALEAGPEGEAARMLERLARIDE